MADAGQRTAATGSDGVAFAALAACCLCTPFSLPAGRVCLAVSLLALAVALVRARRWPAVPPVGWFGLAFVGIAAVVTVFGINPALGVPKLRKLAWFVALPVAATLVGNERRLRLCLGALALGSVALAAEICVRNPVRAQAAVAAGRMAGLTPALIDIGSMTDGQRLLLGIVATLGFLVAPLRPAKAAWRAAWWGALALQSAAMLINFKRGSWASLAVAGGAFVCARRGWRRFLLVLAAMAACLLLPPVRARLGTIRDEFARSRGGRMTMWTVVAPELIRRHPFGIGYRSLTNALMREIAPEIEPNRDHLHSNLAEALVSTGWLGLAVYLAWMTRAVLDGAGFVRATAPRGGADHVLALCLLCMLVGLLVNGLVEYNLGDSEIVLPYAMIMGFAARGLARTRTPAEP